VQPTVNTTGSSPSGGPIFVLGSMGSGTTLTRLILDSHDNIAIAQETGFMRGVLADKWIPFWKFGGEWYSRLGWTEEELDREIEAFYGRIFGRFAREQGKRRWGDKTPYHVWHIEQAARVFPDAVFVATVRHPGAVTASVHKRFGYAVPRATHHWMRINLEMTYQAARLGPRFALCRYEDMVLDPEPTLRELLSWLGEPWSPGVLEHHRVQSDRGTPARVEGRTRSDQPISAAQIGAWATELDEGQRKKLCETTGDLAAFFGYDAADPNLLIPLGAPDGEWKKIVTGTDLAARMAEVGAAIDFDSRPGPTFENRMLTPRVRERMMRVDRAGPGDAAASEVPGADPGASDGGPVHFRRLVAALVGRRRSAS
jgi:hypothetical protein